MNSWLPVAPQALSAHSPKLVTLLACKGQILNLPECAVLPAFVTTVQSVVLSATVGETLILFDTN